MIKCEPIFSSQCFKKTYCQSHKVSSPLADITVWFNFTFCFPELQPHDRKSSFKSTYFRKQDTAHGHLQHIDVLLWFFSDYYSKPWQQYLGINLRQLHAVAKKCKMLQHRRTIRHVVKVVCGFIVLCNQTPQLQVWALRHKAFKITFAVVNFSSYLTVLM